MVSATSKNHDTKPGECSGPATSIYIDGPLTLA